MDLPDPGFFTNYWNKLARENNLNKFYFIGVADNLLPKESGFDKRIRSALSDGITNMKKPFIQKILKQRCLSYYMTIRIW